MAIRLHHEDANVLKMATWIHHEDATILKMAVWIQHEKTRILKLATCPQTLTLLRIMLLGFKFYKAKGWRMKQRKHSSWQGFQFLGLAISLSMHLYAYVGK